MDELGRICNGMEVHVLGRSLCLCVYIYIYLRGKLFVSLGLGEDEKLKVEVAFTKWIFSWVH